MAILFASAKADNDSGKSSSETTIDFGQDVSNAWVVQGGFSTGYSNDHHVKSVEATITSQEEKSQGIEFQSEVQIKDNSGHSGGGTFYAMGIGQTNGDSTKVQTKNSWNPNDGAVEVTFTEQPEKLDQAFVFIQSWKLTYGDDDHHVKTITIDSGDSNLATSSTLEDDGTYTWAITFTPTLKMKDNSGNSEKNDDSYLDLLVMAVPENS